MVKIAILILTIGFILYAYVNFLPIVASYFQQAVVGTSTIQYKVKEVKKKIEHNQEEETDYEKKAEEEIDKLLHLR
ncbi:MAG TPA: hypothetical protein DEP48_01860 [Persephonella sp.]|uniref:Uncharacterized protein n=1 Tax=Persephonella marina (strain DSM 14350 / EX-H1) TaxID=123214 RepID=C0QRP1_PERMH|nr:MULTISPECIES: hypothetical protein [Persephonella]ACO03101.1 hypothetical protein PERMA_1570 [Persephonella marina EX-H1]HCB69082.1 hypothetical protein [Persephonella sp.]